MSVYWKLLPYNHFNHTQKNLRFTHAMSMKLANIAAINFSVKSIKRPLAATAGFLYPAEALHPVFT